MAASTDKYSEQSFTSSENQNFNLNLNQNERCPILIPVQSYSKSNFDKYTASDNCEKEEKLQSYDKSSEIFGFLTVTEDSDDLKKRWKNENTLYSINKSTLSFHIAAFENTNETAAFDLFEGLKKENLGSIKTSRQSFSDAFKFQNPFEFSRQQDGDQSNAPEIMQFKASQRLLSVERLTSLNQNFKQFK
uniref:Uncharacterized protein n=1 Tax=Panagrolaimus sp. PS1159 TaxID=55785 RepID=A0AC35GLK0_9BILA